MFPSLSPTCFLGFRKFYVDLTAIQALPPTDVAALTNAGVAALADTMEAGRPATPCGVDGGGPPH